MYNRRIEKPNKECEFKQARGNNRKSPLLLCWGGQRGSGVTGDQAYLAVVMEETHLLAETSPAEGGGETPRLLPASCLPISWHGRLPLAKSSQNPADKRKPETSFMGQPWFTCGVEQKKREGEKQRRRWDRTHVPCKETDNRIRTTWNLSTQHWMLENGG